MSFSNSLRCPLAVVAGLLLCSVSARSQAATVTLQASDTTGSTSFNAAGNWSNSAAPSAGNSYSTSGFVLRTPPTNGNFTFGGGSLTLAAGGAIGLKGNTAGGTITINNFTLAGGAIASYNGGFVWVLSGTNTVLAQTSTIEVAQTTGSITVASSISGAVDANLNIGETGGTVILGAANTYFGDTDLNAFTLELSNGSALQNSTLKPLSSTTLSFSSNLTAALLGGLSDGAGSTTNIALQNITPAALALSVGNNGVSTTYSGVLSGAGSLIKVGTGTLSLLGSSTYTGGTTINNGVLSFANSGLGTSGSITMGGSSTLQWYGSNTRDVSSRLLLANGAAATLDTQSNNVTFASNFGGASTGSLIKVGAGTLTLAGNTTYSGSTTVAVGTLVVNGSDSSPTVSVAANAILAGSGSANAVNVIPGGAVAAGSGGLGSLTLSALTFSGSGAIDISNITNYVSAAAIDVTGNNALTASGSANSVAIALSGPAPTGTGTVHLLQYTGALQGSGSNALVLNTAGVAFGPRASVGLVYTDPGYVDLSYSVDHPVWSGSGDGTWSTATQTPKNWTLAVAGTATDFLTGDNVLFDDTASSGTVSINAANVAPSAVTFNNNAKNYLLQGAFGITGSTSLAMTGSGTVTIATSNNYTGGTTISNGLLAFASSGLGSGSITLSGTSTLQYYGANTQNISSQLILANGAAATIDTQANNVTFTSGFGAGSTANLTKAGVGTLTLGASTGYTGGTTIQAGVLQLGSATATIGSPGSPLTLSGGTLNLNGNSPTIGTLSGSSGVIEGGTGQSVLTVNTLVNSTYSGSIANNGGILAFTKAGSAALTLLGANTYSSSTTVTGGILKFGSPAAFFAGGQVVVSGGTLDAGGLSLTTGSVTLNSGAITDGTLNASGYSVSAGSISANMAGSSAALAMSGAGQVTLSASNSYGGSTTISGGTLALAGGGALPSTTVVTLAANGANLNLNGTSQTITGLQSIFGATGTTSVTGGSSSSLTIGPTSTSFLVGGNSTGTVTVTLNMSGLGTFSYTNTSSTGKFDLGPQFASGSGNDTGVVNLAGTNTINVAQVSTNATYPGAIATSGTSALNLGAVNTIDTNSLLFPQNARGNMLLDFQTSGSLKLFATDGVSAVPTVNIGQGAGGSGQSTNATVNLTGGTTNALIGTLLVGAMAPAANNTNTNTSLFEMGAGTLSAATINLGQVSVSTGTGSVQNATLLLSNSGEIIAGTLTMGAYAQTLSNTLNSTFNLNSGTLLAGTVQPGAGTVASITRNFNWNNGTIGNATGVPLTINGLTLAMAASGTHVFSIAAGQTGTINGVLADGTPGAALNVSGAGTLILTASNRYTGATTVSTGTLSLTGTGSINSSTVTLNSGGLTLAGAAQVNSPGSVFIDGGTLSQGGNSSITSSTVTLNGGVLAQGGNSSITSGTLTLNSGGLNLSGAAQISSSGGIIINNGELIQDSASSLAPAITLNQGILGGTGAISGNVTVSNSAGAIVQGGDQGSGTLSLNSLTFNGAGQINVALGNSLVLASSLAVNGAAGSVAINGSGRPIATLGEISLVAYNGTIGGSGSSAFTIGSLPSPNRYVAALDFSNPGLIDLNVTAVDYPVWSGSNSSQWSTNTIPAPKNWVLAVAGSGTDFLPADNVLFNDTAASGVVTISGTGNVAPSSVTFNNNSLAYTIGGPFGIVDGVYGPTPLAMTGSGLLTISTSNSYSGGTTVSGGGTLKLGNAYALGTGSLTVNAGTVDLASLSPTVFSLSGASGTITNSGTSLSTLTVNQLAATTFSGTLADGPRGQVALLITGGGTLGLAGSNTYSGGTTIAGGVLDINSDAALGPDSGGLTFAGNGTLQFAAAITLPAARNITVNNGVTATFDTQTLAGTTTIGTVISGSGGLNKIGASLLALSAVSTYTGTTTVSAGTLQIGVGAAGVSLASQVINIGNGAALAFDHSDAMTYSGAIGGSSGGSLIELGPNMLTLTGNNSYGATVVSGGSVMITGSSTLGDAASGPGTLIIASGGFAELSATTNAASSVGTIVLSPSAQLQFAGDLGTAAQAGTLNISGGTLVARIATRNIYDNVYASSDFQLGLPGNNNGFLFQGGQGQVFDLGGPTRTITFDGGTGAATFGGVIQDGSLTKAGSGTIVLAASNTYTGTTTINGGVISLANTAALAGGGNITFGGGTLQFTASNTVDYSGSIVNSTSAISINTGGQGVTFAGVLNNSNSGGLTKLGTGTLFLTASNTYFGGTNLSAGTLNITADAALGDPSGGVTAVGNATLQAGANNIVLPAARSIALNAGTLSVDPAGNTMTIDGVISGSGALAKGLNNVNTIAQPLILSGNNSFTGAVTVYNGWLTITNSLGLGSGTKIITLTNGTNGSPELHLDPGAGPAIDLPVTIGYNLSNTSSAALTDPAQGTIVNDSGNNIIEGNITNTSGGGGTVLTSNSGSIIFLGTYTPTTTGRVLVVRGNRAGTYSGVIANGSTVNLPVYKDSGSGAWTFTALNTYGGATVLQAGTLSVGQLANGGVLSNIGTSSNSAANLVLGGGGLQYTGSGASTDRLFTITPAGGTIDASGSGNAALVFSNGGAIVSSDATAVIGVTEFAATNPTFVQLNGGIGVSSVLAVGMSVNGGGIPSNTSITAVGPNSITISNSATITGADSLTFGISNRTLTLTGSSSGANQLDGGLANSAGGGQLAVNKSGPGFWSLVGTNSYSGGTTVTAGTLQLGNSSSLGTGGLTANGGLLDMNGNSLNVASLSGSAGTISDESSLAGVTTLTVTQSSTTNFGGSIRDGLNGRQVALTMEGPGGTLILSGSSAYSGGTLLDAGTLVDAANGALPDGSSLTISAGATLDFDSTQAGGPVGPALAVSSAEVVAVPEPGTLALLVAGALLAGFGIWRRGK